MKKSDQSSNRESRTKVQNGARMEAMGLEKRREDWKQKPRSVGPGVRSGDKLSVMTQRKKST